MGTMDVIKSSLKYMRNLSKSNPEALQGCRNLDKYCAYWAAIDECEENCSFMKKNCAPSCLMCESECVIVSSINVREKMEEEKKVDPFDDPLEIIAKYGVSQKVEGQREHETLSIINAAIHHMKSLEENPPRNFDKCRNNHELCSFWAEMGECDKNEAYMLLNCGPSCQSCGRFAENTKKYSKV